MNIMKTLITWIVPLELHILSMGHGAFANYLNEYTSFLVNTSLLILFIYSFIYYLFIIYLVGQFCLALWGQA